MEKEKLNLMQELLLQYCRQRNMMNVEITGQATATVMGSDGQELHLTVNIYGDIMDADSKKIIADGNVSHDIRRIYEFPTEWKDRKSSVALSLREKNNAIKWMKESKGKISKTKNLER